MQGDKDDKRRWYVMRAYKKEALAKEMLREIRQEMLYINPAGAPIEYFVPMRYAMRMRHGQRRRELIYAIPSILFVYADEKKIAEIKKRVLILQYFTRKEDGKNFPVIVPRAQMKEFMKIAERYEEDIAYYNPEEIKLEKGDCVRIHGGMFDGLEGTLLKVKDKGKKRVVVKIAGIAAIAASYIEPQYIEIISYNESSTTLTEHIDRLYRTACRRLSDFPEKTDANRDEYNLLQNEVRRYSDLLFSQHFNSPAKEGALCLSLLAAAIALADNDRKTEILNRCDDVLQRLKACPLKALLYAWLYRERKDPDMLVKAESIITSWDKENLTERQSEAVEMVRKEEKLTGENKRNK